MKIAIVLTVLVAAAWAAPAPVDHPNQAVIQNYSFDNIGTDGYQFGFETSDGIARQEQAELKDVGLENPAISVRGSSSWVADDGQTYTINYVADELGYRVEGPHLPK